MKRKLLQTKAARLRRKCYAIERTIRREYAAAVAALGKL